MRARRAVGGVAAGQGGGRRLRSLYPERGGCLATAREALAAAGWPARSWQQDGLLVEDEAQPRRNRDGQIPSHAKAAAMQEAIGDAEAAAAAVEAARAELV